LADPYSSLDRFAIRAEIARRGSSLAEIGRSVNLAKTTMSFSLWSGPHARANKAVADFLGVPLSELWPQWYDADGKVISTKPIARPSREPTRWPPAPSMAREAAA
jgi:Ner family transcriptional regulator